MHRYRGKGDLGCDRADEPARVVTMGGNRLVLLSMFSGLSQFSFLSDHDTR